MPTRRDRPAPTQPARLTVPKAQAALSIQAQIDKGRALRERPISADQELKAARDAYYTWDDFNDALLLRVFDNELEKKTYEGSVFFIGGGRQTLTEEIEEYREGVHQKVRRLESLLAKLEVIEETAGPAAPSPKNIPPAARKRVFIVHGRDDGIKQAAARFIEHLELEPIILDERPGIGRTIIEKFEHNAAAVGYAIVLLTPDDIGKLDGSASEEQRRARQNVLFELGYFAGRLGRDKVCMLRKGDLEMASDLAGVEYISFDGDWRWKLAGEMKAVGLNVDVNRAFDG